MGFKDMGDTRISGGRLVKVGERRCKTIMGRSGIGSVDYAINPYLGCEHGCVYCYARFMLKMGHMGDEWGSFVDVKVNALERLILEAPRKKRGVVLLSSVTDPYQPLERRFELTRGALRILLENQYPIDVLTKSDLVLRDLDLLGKFDDCEVGLTITTYNDDVRKVFEPRASPIRARLDALSKLRRFGIDTYVFLGPLLPYLCEDGLDELLDEIADTAGRVLIDKLNIKCGNMPQIQKVLTGYYPEVRPLFESALLPGSKYYESLREKMVRMFKSRGLLHDFCW